MIFMVALMRGEMDEILGMRLLDTETGKTINVSKAKIIWAMDNQKIVVENIEVINGSLRAIGGALSYYTSEYTDRKSSDKPSIVIIAKTNNAEILLCADSKGNMQTMTLKEIQKRQRFNIANAKEIDCKLVLPSYASKVVALKSEEVNAREQIRQYLAKCKLLDVKPPNLLVFEGRVVLRELQDSFKDYKIPSFITEIEGSNGIEVGINRYKNIRSIVVPSSVTEIGTGTFYSCSNAKMIDISKTQIRDVKEFTFLGCASLEEMVLPDTVTCIGKSAFNGCSNMQSINIPESVEYIGDSAFNGCKSLKNIVIPEGVLEIGESAFSHCFSLKSIRIPPNVLRIDASVFHQNCLQTIEIPERLAAGLELYSDKIRVY